MAIPCQHTSGHERVLLFNCLLFLTSQKHWFSFDKKKWTNIEGMSFYALSNCLLAVVPWCTTSDTSDGGGGEEKVPHTRVPCSPVVSFFSLLQTDPNHPSHSLREMGTSLSHKGKPDQIPRHRVKIKWHHRHLSSDYYSCLCAMVLIKKGKVVIILAVWAGLQILPLSDNRGFPRLRAQFA